MNVMNALDLQAVRQYQNIAVNAWPALETVIHHGWLLRFADGFSKRANSVHPLAGGGPSLADMVDYCEQVYARRGIAPAFRMTDAAQPSELDDYLANRGYAVEFPVSVQMVPLTSLGNPVHPSIRMYTHLTEEWLDDFYLLQPGLLDRRGTTRRMFSKIVPDHGFAILRTEAGDIAACGFTVVEQGYAGVFNVFTNPAYRRQGFAESMILHLFAWAKERGAHTGYLQVVRDNHNALNLYQKIGFREVFSEWYRVKGGVV